MSTIIATILFSLFAGTVGSLAIFIGNEGDESRVETGTLDLTMAPFDSQACSGVNLAPGATGNCEIRFTNSGSITGALFIDTRVEDESVGCNLAEQEASDPLCQTMNDLSSYLVISAQEVGGSGQLSGGGGVSFRVGVTSATTVAELPVQPCGHLTTLDPGEDFFIRYNYQISNDITNAYQSDVSQWIVDSALVSDQNSPGITCN